MAGWWRLGILAVATCAAVTAAAVEPAPAKPRVRFSASPAVAGSDVSIDVSAVSVDGAPIDVPVTLDVDVGRLSPPDKLGAGKYRFTLTVPRRLPASRTAFFLARGGGPTVEAALPLVPGPAATLQVNGPPSCPVGEEACQIELRAEDAFGNGAAEMPWAEAALGRITPPGAEGPGRWVFFYHSPRTERLERDKVKLAVGGLQAEHQLTIRPQRLRFELAVQGGLALQQGKLGPAVGAQALGTWLLRSGWRVGGGLEGSWWKTTRSGSLTVPADPAPAVLAVEVDRSQAAVGLVGAVEGPLGRRLALRLSAGAGLVRASGVARISDQPSVSAAGWAPAGNVTAGLGWRLRRGMPFAELRAAWVGDAHLDTDRGAKAPLFLLVGYRIDVE